jgi:hypothetical protein
VLFTCAGRQPGGLGGLHVVVVDIAALVHIPDPGVEGLGRLPVLRRVPARLPRDVVVVAGMRIDMGISIGMGISEDIYIYV